VQPDRSALAKREAGCALFPPCKIAHHRHRLTAEQSSTFEFHLDLPFSASRLTARWAAPHPGNNEGVQISFLSEGGVLAQRKLKRGGTLV
jgi:hypothetical protein